jgi:hypothetical protein
MSTAPPPSNYKPPSCADEGAADDHQPRPGDHATASGCRMHPLPAGAGVAKPPTPPSPSAPSAAPATFSIQTAAPRRRRRACLPVTRPLTPFPRHAHPWQVGLAASSAVPAPMCKIQPSDRRLSSMRAPPRAGRVRRMRRRAARIAVLDLSWGVRWAR